MEWILSSISSMFTVMIVLGVPVIVLYAYGWHIHEVGRRQTIFPSCRRNKGEDKYSSALRSNKRIKCWDLKECPTEARETCPAVQYPNLSCWQAVKTAFGGRIKEDCPECQMFLSH